MEIEALKSRIAALEEDNIAINETLLEQIVTFAVWKDVLKALIASHPRIDQFEERFEALVTPPGVRKAVTPHEGSPELRQAREKIRRWIRAVKKRQAQH